MRFLQRAAKQVGKKGGNRGYMASINSFLSFDNRKLKPLAGSKLAPGDLNIGRTSAALRDQSLVPAKKALPQHAAQESRADGQNEADRDNEQQHANDMEPRVRVFGFELRLH
jgi:hypothetical protein